MSAVPRPQQAPPAAAQPALATRPMRVSDLDIVLEIERSAYAFPWSRGNFIDSLAAGYWACLLCDESSGELVAYAVAMDGVGESHLLNLTVQPAHEHRGHARRLLRELVAHARERGSMSLWLEVRQSNQRARAVYQRYGFAEVGTRRGYYPAAGQQREDAQVLRLDLESFKDEQR